MLGAAGETEFDVRLTLFGIYVRIHPLFWVMAAFVVWQSTPDPKLKFLGVLCVLLSILVHELGHAVFIRKWGYPSEIVLYGMGGYATSTQFSTWRSVWISFAGPLAGFVLYGIVYGIKYGLARFSPESLSIDAVGYCIWLLLWINLYWGIMNLAPVLPLDGGRIVQALMMRYAPRRGVERTLQVSIVAAGTIAYWGFTQNEQFLMIMFGIFCAQSVIAYNEYNARR